MTVEAQTLARSCLESAFFLCAAAADTGFADRLVSSDTAHKKKVATWLTSPEAAVTELSSEQLDKLRGFLANIKKAAPSAALLSIKQAADAARLSDVYETVYRDLSDRAAHPSLNSLLRHIELDDHGNAVALHFGPEMKDLPETVLAMTTALFYGVVGMGSAFAQDAWRAEIDTCWEIHKQLVDAREAVYEAQIAAGGA
jgi:enoyl-CoA hydratase/carnithine racemase